MDGWAGNVKKVYIYKKMIKKLNKKIKKNKNTNDKEVNLPFFASAMFS